MFLSSGTPRSESNFTNCHNSASLKPYISPRVEHPNITYRFISRFDRFSTSCSWPKICKSSYLRELNNQASHIAFFAAFTNFNIFADVRLKIFRSSDVGKLNTLLSHIVSLAALTVFQLLAAVRRKIFKHSYCRELNRRVSHSRFISSFDYFSAYCSCKT